MAEVTQEDIVEVFGRVAPDYSDIPPETWRQVVSSLYGMEKREFDAFVDELEAQSKEGGTPDIRRSLVEIYDNAKKQVRETPEAAGRSEEEITEATNRVFSNIRRVVRDPSSLREVREKGLVQWSRDNAGREAGWAPRPTFRTGIEAPEAMGMSGMSGDPRQMRMPLEPLSVDFTQLDPGPTDYTQYLERAAAREAMAENRPIEEEFFSETAELVPEAPPGGWLDPADGGNRSPEWFQGGADQWMALSPQQRRRAAQIWGPAPIEEAFGDASVLEEATAVATPAGTAEVTETVSETGVPSLDDMLAGGDVGGAPTVGVAGTIVDPSSAPVPGDSQTNYALPGSPQAPAEGEGGGFWSSPKSQAGAIVGAAGIASAIGNTIADFRTTAALEDQLAASAAGWQRAWAGATSRLHWLYETPRWRAPARWRTCTARRLSPRRVSVESQRPSSRSYVSKDGTRSLVGSPARRET